MLREIQFIIINIFYVEANFIVKICEEFLFPSFCHNLRGSNSCKVEVLNLVQLVRFSLF